MSDRILPMYGELVAMEARRSSSLGAISSSSQVEGFRLTDGVSGLTANILQSLNWDCWTWSLKS